MKKWVRILIAPIFLLGASMAQAADVTASRLGDSVFRDAWHAILSEAQLEVRMISAPRDVRRDMFARGELVLDCCSVPEWRDRDDEKAAQLWSYPFFYTVDHLILQAGRSYDLPDPTDLLGYKVGIVQGFSYRLDDRFGSTLSRVSLDEVFELVATGGADMTIANHQEFRRRQALKPRPLVLGPAHHELGLMARVHKSRPDLLVRLNDAIRRLKASGQIAALTGARLRAGAVPDDE